MPSYLEQLQEQWFTLVHGAEMTPGEACIYTSLPECMVEDIYWEYFQAPALRKLESANTKPQFDPFEVFGVPRDWALGRKKTYHEGQISILRDDIVKVEQSMAGLDTASLTYSWERIDAIELQVAKHIQLLHLLDNPGCLRSALTEAEIQSAKDYPIEQLLPNPIVRKNKTLCFNHDEKTPSMHINFAPRNDVHCFGACNKTWDSIGLVMQIHGLDFPGAVRFLLGR